MNHFICEFPLRFHAEVIAVWRQNIVYDWTDDDEIESPTWQTAEPRICGGRENISLLLASARKGYFRDSKFYVEKQQQTSRRI